MTTVARGRWTSAPELVDRAIGTNPSEAGKAENRDNDLALWGAPRVVVR